MLYRKKMAHVVGYIQGRSSKQKACIVATICVSPNDVHDLPSLLTSRYHTQPSPLVKIHMDRGFTKRRRGLLCSFVVCLLVAIYSMKLGGPSFSQNCAKLLHTSATASAFEVGVPEYIPKALLYIVTPCSRPQNLPSIRKAFASNYDWIWVIIYTVRPLRREFPSDPRIYEFWLGVEATHEDDPWTYANLGRNFALGLVSDASSYIYFLDDDNIIHPNFWKLVYAVLQEGQSDFITFDQFRTPETVLVGPRAIIGKIDTGMFVTQRGLTGHIRWRLQGYADFFFAEEMQNTAHNHTYINQTCAYYNFVTQEFPSRTDSE